jgi:hypothetical protein
MKTFQAGAMRVIAAHSSAAQGEDWTDAAIAWVRLPAYPVLKG